MSSLPILPANLAISFACIPSTIHETQLIRSTTGARGQSRQLKSKNDIALEPTMRENGE
jgi:hypothetical protein